MDNELRKQIGERLKESRKAAGYTQAGIAEIMNMTQQQYSRFENGLFELNYEQIIKLCKLYDISADYLFGLKAF
ncbi:MAG: helix-turn-helix domain-containing protein [Clostridia bacterium]|nr:helix-turn-helix domain-containing protein [Clostridia bacterium]